MNKIKNIQALRGIAVLFVVFFHLYIDEIKYSHFHTILPNILQVGNFGVDLFFVISGFVMVTITRGKFQNTKQSILFLYNRFTRIYPLYWIYSILILVVFLIKPTWVNSSQGNQVNILASFLLMPSDKLPLIQVAWSLVHEIYFYIVFFFIILIVPENYLVYSLTIWGVCVALLDLTLKTTSPFLSLVSSPLTLEFLGGCFLGILYYRTKVSKSKPRMFLLIGGISFLMVMIGFYCYRAYTGIYYPEGWWRSLLFGLPALGITYGMINAEQNGLVLHSTLSYIGDASYSIYLSHLLTINTVGKVWTNLSFNHWLNNVIFILIALGLTVLIGFISYWFVEIKLIAISRSVIKSRL